MLNREQYERDIRAAKEAQIKELTLRLSEVFDVNTDIRNQDITTKPDEALLHEVMNIEIPKAGRDAREIADELVNKVFKASLLTQHPRFFPSLPAAFRLIRSRVPFSAISIISITAGMRPRLRSA